MGRRSTLEDLPKDILQMVQNLLIDGVTLDDIMSALETAGADHISRSSVGRYKISQDALAAEYKRTQVLSEVLVKLNGGKDSHMSRVGINMLQGIMMKTVAAEFAKGDLKLDAKETHYLARAFKDLSSAQSIDDARIAKIETAALTKAAKAVTGAQKSLGLSPETADEIRNKILGVKI